MILNEIYQNVKLSLTKYSDVAKLGFHVILNMYYTTI